MVSAQSLASLAADCAEQLHASGVRLSGQIDARGVALARCPQVPGLTTVDELLAMLLAGHIQGHLTTLEKAEPK